LLRTDSATDRGGGGGDAREASGIAGITKSAASRFNPQARSCAGGDADRQCGRLESIPPYRRLLAILVVRHPCRFIACPPMRATDFEYHQQTLVHQLVIGGAFLAYVFQPDGVVWWLVKNRPAPHVLERALFILATLLIAVGATVCTRTRASRRIHRTR